MEGNGRGEENVKGKEGERWREGFGPPKNFGVAPPMVGTLANQSIIQSINLYYVKKQNSTFYHKMITPSLKLLK